MPALVNVESKLCRKRVYGCPHCKSLCTMWTDPVNGVFVVRHGNATSIARSCPNIHIIAIDAIDETAIKLWQESAGTGLSKRIRDLDGDAVIRKTFAEKPEPTIGDMYKEYAALQESLRVSVYRVVDLCAVNYCLVYFDTQHDGIQVVPMNKASNVKVNLIDGMSPESLVAFANIQKAVADWVASGMKGTFPVSNDADVYALHQAHVSQQITG